MTLHPPLTSAQLKFDRGCEHLNALHKAIGLFLANKKTYSVLDEYAPAPQTQGYVRFLEAAPVPDEVSLLIGDAGHNFRNFRSCLDHIAWQLAAAENAKGNITDHWKESEVSFPIYASRRKYLRKRKRAWRHVGLTGVRRRTLRRLQPYQRRDAPEAHPLWHLHWLSNIDKHQVLHTTLVGLGEEMPPPGEFSKTLIDPTTGEIEYVYTPPAESIPQAARCLSR